MKRPKAEAPKEPRRFPSPVGHPLALLPQAIDFDWFFMALGKPNDRLPSGVEVVHIEGPLEHHRGWWFDSYESILERIEGAMTGETALEAEAWEHRGDKDYKLSAAIPAKAVVLCFDSPGGEAAGATWAHRKIRALRSQHNIPVYAYANELAASAAYELACAADEIWLPDTGVVGSIGVIATAFDRTKQNEKIGLNIELITSGSRKADGHPDRVLDDGIRQRIQRRVDELAAIFFEVVADARGTNVKAIADLEADTFLGADAVEAGVADGVSGWEAFLEMVTESVTEAADDVAVTTAA